MNLLIYEKEKKGKNLLDEYKIDACFRSNKHHQINIYRENHIYSM